MTDIPTKALPFAEETVLEMRDAPSEQVFICRLWISLEGRSFLEAIEKLNKAILAFTHQYTLIDDLPQAVCRTKTAVYCILLAKAAHDYLIPPFIRSHESYPPQPPTEPLGAPKRVRAKRHKIGAWRWTEERLKRLWQAYQRGGISACQQEYPDHTIRTLRAALRRAGYHLNQQQTRRAVITI